MSGGVSCRMDGSELGGTIPLSLTLPLKGGGEEVGGGTEPSDEGANLAACNPLPP